VVVVKKGSAVTFLLAAVAVIVWVTRLRGSGG